MLLKATSEVTPKKPTRSSLLKSQFASGVEKNVSSLIDADIVRPKIVSGAYHVKSKAFTRERKVITIFSFNSRLASLSTLLPAPAKPVPPQPVVVETHNSASASLLALDEKLIDPNC